MDTSSIMKMTNRIDFIRAQSLLPGLLKAWEIAEVNTVLRRAMWFAQTLEESIGLSATTELGSGSEYENRADLGNTQPGDGPRFKGRGFIQLTGRSHYGSFSKWCYSRGLVPNDHYFLDHPDEVASSEFAWISAAFYWVGDHNHGYRYLNAAADARDLVAATWMVNGGLNGFDTRKYYYNLALSLGDELLGGSLPHDDPNWSDMATKAEIQKMIDDRIAAALFGGNKALHRQRPVLYPDASHGVFDRLINHGQRLNNHLEALQRQHVQVTDVVDDVSDLKKDVASMQKEIDAEVTP